MKLGTWNVNSIRARLERLKMWLGENAPDVLCLQETKVEDTAFPADDLRALGYDIAFHGQRTYNGVAILSKVPLQDVSRGLPNDADDAQCRFLVARVGDIRVASVYVPNGQAVGTDKFHYKLNWLRRCRAWLDQNVRADEAFALCGDFNIAPEDRDVHDPAVWKDQVHCHPDERALLAEIMRFGLEDLFRRHHPQPGAFSWWDYRMLAFPKNRGLRIDHILGTAPLAARCRDVVIDRNARKGKEPSDHVPVVATID